MKNITGVLVLLVFVTSCSSTHRETANQDSSVDSLLTAVVTEQATDIIVPEEKEPEEVEPQEKEPEDDCIFDQSTQTDEFLKGIKELENYEWDDITKTATIPLDNGDTLYVSRGGCYSFGVSALLKTTQNTSQYADWNQVFEQALWMSEVLQSEFAHEELKIDIESNKIEIESYDDQEVVTFSDEYLQSNHYELTRTLGEEAVTIELSYYIN
ncbi:hypothetical protein [Reichenbachiella ulvae]|uniref:Uncharacterized protein n=1 Tax=Reichenbachiella ulvae TaxID=2980104 RepID=A0ABT3CNA5_9BACT|nr:hypothetical protein [Reichenbachiella ulvae]MCV9385067.1 hypothetical protein [Reichenbachiella ulvae]